MNEANAITFLRSLLHFEPSTLPDGKPDPGWCCQEHAIIGTLGFVLSGTKAFRCTGALIVGAPDSGIGLDIFPHEFVIIADPFRVFDSSISYRHIHGVPTQFGLAYSDLAVALFSAKPTRDDFLREHARCGKPLFALYADKSRMAPNKNALSWVSHTPFGLWLTARYGSQSGLWSRAAWFTAEHLAGRLSLGGPKVSKESLWDRVASSPDRDELASGFLEPLPNET